MKGPKLRAAIKPLVGRIEAELRAAAREGLADEAKRERVIDKLTDAGDTAMKWPKTLAGMLAEFGDGIALRIIIAALVHEIADRIEAGEAS